MKFIIFILLKKETEIKITEKNFPKKKNYLYNQHFYKIYDL